MAGISTTDPLIGQILSERYRVLERIGRGGFGAVYRVQHIRLDKTLALKVLFDRTGENPRMIKRFEREARAACRIGHDNIVEITDFARFGDHGYYFVMEYLEGETLGRRIKRLGPMGPGRLVHVGCQIADALAATHSKGIIHRDLKPDNVFLTHRRADADFVKVLDFGIAAMMEPGEHAIGLTDHGAMLGTPVYMSPEQATGLAATAQSDIYSLGILLYEMATGAVPFRDQNAMSVLEMHRAREPMAPRAARPDLDIPDGIEAVILRALRKSLTQRYSSMREVQAELMDALPAATIETGPPGSRSYNFYAGGGRRGDHDGPDREPIEWLEAEEALVLLDPEGAGDSDSDFTAPLPVPGDQATPGPTTAMPVNSAGAAAPSGGRTVPGKTPSVITSALRDESPPASTTLGDDATFVRPALQSFAPAPTPRPTGTGPIGLVIEIPIPGAEAKPRPSRTDRPTPAPTERIGHYRPATHRPWVLAAIGFTSTVALYALMMMLIRTTAPTTTTQTAEPPAAPSNTDASTPAVALAPAAAIAVTPVAAVSATAPGAIHAERPAGPAPVEALPTTIALRGLDEESHAEARPLAVPVVIRDVDPPEARLRAGVALTTESVIVRVETDPPGGTVTVGGVALGAAPVDAVFPSTGPATALVIEKNGYQSVKRTLAESDSPVLVVKLRKRGGGGGGGGGGGYDKW